MDDHISREAAIKVLKDPTIDHKERAINRLPAADVVSVVRCKECAFYECLFGVPYRVCKLRRNREHGVTEMDFCSSGVRKMESDDVH